MPPGTWTFAGDEAGQTSFRFDRGATRYFVVAIIGTREPETLRQALKVLRQEYRLPANYEFGSHKTTGRHLRSSLMETISRLDFQTWAVVVDKVKLSDRFRIMTGQQLYVYFVAEAMQLIPTTWCVGATLTLDQFDEAGSAITALKREWKRRGVGQGFKEIRGKRSRGEDLIQIADLMAGAILRKYEGRDDKAFQAVGVKLDSLKVYPEEKPPS
ncbi:MAG: DUF3800 domain-containing protein [Chloroflexota bacterium]